MTGWIIMNLMMPSNSRKTTIKPVRTRPVQTAPFDSGAGITDATIVVLLWCNDPRTGQGGPFRQRRIEIFRPRDPRIGLDPPAAPPAARLLCLGPRRQEVRDLPHLIRPN